MSKQLSTYFQIQIEHSLTLYKCTSCSHNISENKPSIYQVPNKDLKNKIIPSIQKLAQLEERFIFVQIYKP